jgi:hypothetical protein
VHSIGSETANGKVRFTGKEKGGHFTVPPFLMR